MDISKLKRQLIIDEGISLRLYQDTVGKWTIGIGRNLEDRGISLSEAHYLLDNDIYETMHYLEKYSWFDLLTDVRQRVVVNMCFNLGMTKFSSFRNMIKALAERNYFKASLEMLDSKWARQVGDRAKRLAKMMETGVDI